jgi:hypothetical protein
MLEAAIRRHGVFAELAAAGRANGSAAERLHCHAAQRHDGYTAQRHDSDAAAC